MSETVSRDTTHIASWKPRFCYPRALAHIHIEVHTHMHGISPTHPLTFIHKLTLMYILI